MNLRRGEGYVRGVATNVLGSTVLAVAALVCFAFVARENSTVRAQTPTSEGIVQASITLSDGMSLEAEIGAQPNAGLGFNCQNFTAQEIEGSRFMLGNANLITVNGNCAYIEFTDNRPGAVLTGAAGQLGCGANGYHECVAILKDAETGKILWNDGFRAPTGWLSRNHHEQPLSLDEPVSGRYQLQLFLFASVGYPGCTNCN